MSWRTGFLISLAVNVLIIGGLLGFVLGGGLTQVRNAGSIALGQPRELAAALPADVRQALRRDLVRAWFETNAERAAWRAANADVVTQLEAENYDVAAMREALGRQREAGVAAVAKFQEELAQSLAELTPEQRRAAAAALTRLRNRDDRADDGAFSGDDAGEQGQTPREAIRDRVLDRLRERRAD